MVACLQFQAIKNSISRNFLFMYALIKICTQFEGYIPQDVIIISQTMCMFMGNDKQFSKIIRQIPSRSTYEFQLLNIFPNTRLLSFFFSILFILVGALQYCNMNQIPLSYITDHVNILFFKYLFRYFALFLFDYLLLLLFVLFWTQFLCRTYELQIYFPLTDFIIHFLNGVF